MGKIITKEDTIYRQRLLKFYGFDCGPIDGIWGPKSQAAEDAFTAKCLYIKNNYLGTSYVTSRTESVVQTLHPILQKLAWEFVTKTSLQVANIKRVELISGLRTYEEQQHLYDKGRTTIGNIVTYSKPGKSFHNFGIAFDLGIFTKNGYVENDSLYILTHEQVKDIVGLEWGGDWTLSHKDTPHYQLKTGLPISSLRSLFEDGKELKVLI
jgi:peptidoglycan L-alanyl-D-glutamate endopeptidase CwlK